MRILRGLSSRVLPCGCVAGVYETYDGHVVVLIDEHDATCADVTHREGDRISPAIESAVQQGSVPVR